jgi:serine/threonine protein kinase
MAEQPPELIARIGSTPAGALWRARQQDGGEVLAAQTLLAEEASRQAALDRLRRLARIPSRQLAPIRGWWSDREGVWVVGDLEEGVGLPELPGGGFLSPQQAAAISVAVLEGLKALHAEGLSHGALGPDKVRVMPDGQVLLTGHQLSRLGFPSQEELAAEVRESGRIVCQAFGITPERTAGAPRAIEHAAPALVVTARAIAAGTMRSDINAALSALRETSGPLAGAERLGLGAAELGALVTAKRGGSASGELRFRSLSAPIGSGSLSATPSAPAPAAPSPPPPPPPAPLPSRPVAPLPAAPVPAAAQPPRRSWEERKANPMPPPEDHDREGPNWLLIGGAVVLLLLIGLGIWAGRGFFLGSTGPSAGVTPGPSAAASPSPSGAPSPTPTPGVVPTFAPASAGNVTGVTVAPSAGSSCAPGAACTLNVKIAFHPTQSTHDVTWSFKTYDVCTGAISDLSGGTISADGSWNNTDGNSPVSLPAARGQLAVVALSGPDVAASTPLLLGTAGGC